MTTQLPNKLSALLRLAVADAQKCEAMPETYVLDMSNWHAPDGAGCNVCMAGAVIAQTLLIPPSEDVGYNSFGEEKRRALGAIDDMRTGAFATAHRFLKLSGPTRDQDLAMVDAGELVRSAYRVDNLDHFDEDEDEPLDHFGRAPWPVYLEAAAILEGAGL
jgi:hypothetical protein